MTVYVNGVPNNGTLSRTVTGGQRTSTRDVFIGQRADSSGYNFNGTIDEVRIDDRAVSEAEIEADMKAAIAPATPDTVPPEAPAGLSAASAGQTLINLVWNASIDNFDVTGYRVERCQYASCANFVEVGTANDRTFHDTGLTEGTSYSYRVRATDQAGNFSSYSGAVSATPAAGRRVGAYPFEEGSGTTTAAFSGPTTSRTLNAA